MDEKGDNQEKINPYSFNNPNNLNNPQNNQYNPQNNQNFGFPTNQEVIELSRHQEMCNLLRDIRDNGANQMRMQRENVYTNFSVVFLTIAFIIYMLVQFYQNGGFDYPIPCKLLAMIISILILVILLHRHEVNILENLNKNNRV